MSLIIPTPKNGRDSHDSLASDFSRFNRQHDGGWRHLTSPPRRRGFGQVAVGLPFISRYKPVDQQ